MVFRADFCAGYFKDTVGEVKDGGVDITPLRNLIHQVIDEEKIRNCGKEFCLSTFSLTDKKELTLSVADIEEGLLEDFLLASASI